MADDAAVRDQVRSWLRDNWDPERPLVEWRSLLVTSGWGCPTWPEDRFGRGLDSVGATVVAEEFASAGAVGPAGGAGMSLAAPTILAHGSDDLQRRLLRGIATGEDTWCQLFSEPGNGSDLAGLTTKAVRDGDEWIVDGQKVWTTNAHRARYGMLLARTDWDVPKHRGISYFAIPMDQPGVEVRPLRQANGHQSFNEVFLTEARVAADLIIGDEGDGWRVALTTLAHERGLASVRFGQVPPGARGRTAREAAEEAAAYAKTYEWYPQRAGRADLLQPRAAATGRAGDATVRQQLAAVHSVERTGRWNVQRARDARAAGQPPGPEGSLAKLIASDIARSSSRAHGAIAGAHGMLSGADGHENGIVTEILISTPAASIAGGTDEIQRNILGERILGLPKEPQVDRDVPFRDVKINVRADRGH